MTIIKIEKNEKIISVSSQYNPDLPKPAKNLGGKWDGEAWLFDIRDEARVKDLYLKIYGEWPEEGAEPHETVTAKVSLHDTICEWRQGIYFAGRQIARATGRDSGARLAAGVVVLEGGFTSGGSWKNWETIGKKGTVFEVRDVPLIKIQEEIDEADNNWTIEILGEVDTAALIAEKERLQNRIAVIDRLLAKAA